MFVSFLLLSEREGNVKISYHLRSGDCNSVQHAHEHGIIFCQHQTLLGYINRNLKSIILTKKCAYLAYKSSNSKRYNHC